MKRKLKQSRKNLKDNLKNNSTILLKVILPELDLDWDGLYFYFKEKKDETIKKIKRK